MLALPCPWCKCTLDLTYYISEGGPDTTQQHDTQQTQQQQQQQQQAAMRTQSPAVSSIYLSHALPAHRAAVSPPVGTAAQHATRRVADDNLRAAEASASPGADRRGDDRVAETRQLIQNLRSPTLAAVSRQQRESKRHVSFACVSSFSVSFVPSLSWQIITGFS